MNVLDISNYMKIFIKYDFVRPDFLKLCTDNIFLLKRNVDANNLNKLMVNVAKLVNENKITKAYLIVLS
jgi:hypothetical protein